MGRRTNIFEYHEYKLFLRDRLSEVKKSKKSITLQKVSQRIGIQYTYLSKVLRSDDSHLNESHLYQFAKILDLVGDEIDYLLLLRNREATTDSDFQEHLTKKIDQISARQVVVAELDSPRAFTPEEYAYLTNPLAVLMDAGFGIERYRKDPYQFASLFGISHREIDKVLKILEQSGMIEVNWESMKISHTDQDLHFGKDHPLMRSHQLAMKTFMNARLIQSSEESKENFAAAFTTSAEAMNQIKNEIKQTLRRVQEISTTPKQEVLCQLNIDLLRWL